MDTRIKLGISGIILAYAAYKMIIKDKRENRSDFVLIRAWGVVIIGIMVAIICFILVLFGLD
ncbi:MAG: hypothetical protein HG457_003500 [Flavobacteriaceae bacterium]|jgi:hypothetical protein|nr:hypothetical protein [Flavobacteriaceae bacterium]